MTPKTEPPQTAPAPAFAVLGVNEPLCKAIERFGWTTPSEIQAKLIPPALAGHDILGQARTGTGKTAAFGLPVLQRLEEGHGVRCLVLTPTRELAAQVGGELRLLGKFTPHGVMVAYGGTRVRKHAEELKAGPAIVVGTPGRVMDLMGRGMLKLSAVKFAVLDEVDRMLDIGFREDIRKILGHIRHAHQTIFVSATIEDEINRLARQYMTDPVEVFCAPDKLTVDEVDQYFITVAGRDKPHLLVKLLQQEKPELAIVFTRTKRDTARVAKTLKAAGINAHEIHGDLYQSKREKIIRGFRQGRIEVLVATDLASRGLDIQDVSHVINYDISEDPSAYVHRVGRTARMGEQGKAVTFVTPDQGKELTEIEKLINKEIHTMAVEGFKPGPLPTEQPRPEAPPPPGRHEVGVFGEGDKAVRKTLGSKFKPRRKKRL